MTSILTCSRTQINSSNIRTSHNIIQYRKNLDYKKVQELVTCKFNVGGNAYELEEKVNNFNDILISSIDSIAPLVKAMPHGSDFYNEFAKIHQIYEKTYRAMEFLTKSL